MRFDKIWTVARKDLAEFKTNKYVMYSVILMPLLMAVVLPVIYLAPMTAYSTSNQPLDLELNLQDGVVGQDIVNGTYTNVSFIDCRLTNVVAVGCSFERSNVTTSLVKDSFLGNSTLAGSALVHSNIYNLSSADSVFSNVITVGQTSADQSFLASFVDFLMLFFIMIPVIIPTVMASYSFVGEKLNRSLEPLLATPTTDAELLAGKTLSIFLPCMLVTWLSFIPFVFIVDMFTTPLLGYAPVPNTSWIIGVFLIAPLFCVMSIALNVVVSSRVVDVRASQQIGSLVVLPIVVFFIVVLAGFFVLGPEIMLALAGVVLLADLGIAWLTLKTFRREEILIRWK